MATEENQVVSQFDLAAKQESVRQNVIASLLNREVAWRCYSGSLVRPGLDVLVTDSGAVFLDGRCVLPGSDLVASAVTWRKLHLIEVGVQ